MAEVRSRLEAAVKDASSGMITAEFVAQYIDRILVTNPEPNIANLEIKIFTGRTTQKWLDKLKARHAGRTGNIMKIIIHSSLLNKALVKTALDVTWIFILS